jgi:hypothetical protein
MSVENYGGRILTGENQRIRRKICPIARLCTLNTIWTDSGANPGFQVERPETNRLSHGTTFPEYEVSRYIKSGGTVSFKFSEEV